MKRILVGLLLAGCQTATTPKATPTETTPSATPVATETPRSADFEYTKAKGQAGYAAALRQKPRGNAGKGKDLFVTNCAGCHAPELWPEPGLTLNPPPPRLEEPQTFKYGRGDLAVFRTIKYGVEATGMTPWEGRMTDDECWHVVAYLKKLRPRS